MLTRTFSRFPAAFLVWVALTASAVCGANITVTDDKGRSIEVELISLVDNSVTFRRAGSPKEYSLPISQFVQASQDLIRKQAGDLPAVMPKIQPEIMIGKRRQKDDSSYMVKQEITCTVKFTNLSLTTPVPALKGKVVFIGQNRRTPELLYVLSTQSLEVSINPGATFSREMEAFMTSYDSDNKGSGNIGGYQYFGYILVLMDDAGKVVLDQTATASIRQALSAKPALLTNIIKYPQAQLLTEKLEPSAVSNAIRVLR